jgi:hypothetical protein
LVGDQNANIFVISACTHIPGLKYLQLNALIIVTEKYTLELNEAPRHEGIYGSGIIAPSFLT